MRCIPCLLCLLAAAGLAAAATEADLPPLVEQPHDILILKDDSQLVGTVVSVDAKGTVRFRTLGQETGSTGYFREDYQGILPQRLAPAIVTERIRLLVANPGLLNRDRRIRETFEWGLQKGQEELVRSLAVTTASAMPESYELAEWVIGLMGRDPAGLAALEDMIRAVVGKNRTWVAGREHLLEILIAAGDGRAADLDREVAELLKVNPHNYRANSIDARIAERDGNFIKAQMAHFTAMGRSPGDHGARAGYARCSLMLGEDEAAAKHAQELVTAGQELPMAQAILGTVLLKRGDDAAALPLLQQADTAGVTGPLRTIVRSNLALAHLRRGDHAAAAAIWREMDDEYSRVGLALAVGEPIAADRVTDEHLRQVANEHNLSLELRRPEPALPELVAQLQVGAIPRHTFLHQLVQLVETKGSEGEVRTLLKRYDTMEARRWAVYGHILAKRWEAAEAVLAGLPADDGYAAVCRVYLAFVQQDRDRAKALYKQEVEALVLRGGVEVPPPADYVQELAAYFDVISGEFRRFDFDIADGEILGPSWASRARGTGIRVHVQNQHLVLEGTQLAGREAITRSWCTTLKREFHEAWLTIDPSQATGAIVGLEILDGSLADGLSIGIVNGTELRWREIRGGRPDRWQSFPEKVTFEPDKPLRLRHLSGNRVSVAAYKGTDDLLVSDPFTFSGKLAVSIFGEAPVGTAWRLSVDRLDIR